MLNSINENAINKVKDYSANDAFIIAGLVMTGFFSMAFVLGLVIEIIGVRIGYGYGWFADSQYFDYYWLFLMLSFYLLVPLAYFRYQKYTVDFRNFGFIKPKWSKKLLIYYVLALILIELGIFSTGLLPRNLIFNFNVSESSLVDSLVKMYAPMAFILALLIIGLIVPLIEELFFRGLIFRGLTYRFNFITSALFSSLLFALLGVEIRGILFVFSSGFIYSYLVYKSGSLWPSIGAHTIVNVSAVILAFQ